MIFYGQTSHGQAHFKGGEVPGLLMGRVGGGEEPEAVQRQDLADLFRGAQVAEMDGVEGSPEEAQTLRPLRS
jgi:hypothetical protein